VASQPLLCIMGPTASGKTDLAIDLAKALGGELVSVDSVLVYRGLDVGSAKPDYPHHLVDICDPADPYSAARFVNDATAAIALIRGRGRRPILVGGSMLYFRALLSGLAAMPGADPEVRQRIESEAQSRGWPHMHSKLAAVDPQSAARIHPNHSQRLVRALEVYELTGSPLSRLHEGGGERGLDEPVLAVALAPMDRGVLHHRIEKRFQGMLDAGFVDEVRRLMERPDLHSDLPALRAVGYRQLCAYLRGEYSLEVAAERAVIATRQLAKRQFTWLRKWPDLHWIYTNAEGGVIDSDFTPTAATEPASTVPANLLLNYLTYNSM
jgi:tRNA dimethylallyltransferase